MAISDMLTLEPHKSQTTFKEDTTIKEDGKMNHNKMGALDPKKSRNMSHTDKTVEEGKNSRTTIRGADTNITINKNDCRKKNKMEGALSRADLRRLHREGTLGRADFTRIQSCPNKSGDASQRTLGKADLRRLRMEGTLGRADLERPHSCRNQFGEASQTDNAGKEGRKSANFVVKKNTEFEKMEGGNKEATAKIVKGGDTGYLEVSIHKDIKYMWAWDPNKSRETSQINNTWEGKKSSATTADSCRPGKIPKSKKGMEVIGSNKDQVNKDTVKGFAGKADLNYMWAWKPNFPHNASKMDGTAKECKNEEIDDDDYTEVSVDDEYMEESIDEE